MKLSYLKYNPDFWWEISYLKYNSDFWWETKDFNELKNIYFRS